MSIVVLENKKRYGGQRKLWIFITALVVFICVTGFAFLKALDRTIPKSSPQVDEEILQSAIVSIYGQPLAAGEDILLRVISRERDLATNRDYLEYGYEYRTSGISHTGHLTVCYEYQNKEWRLVSIGITNLNEK